MELTTPSQYIGLEVEELFDFSLSEVQHNSEIVTEQMPSMVPPVSQPSTAQADYYPTNFTVKLHPSRDKPKTSYFSSILNRMYIKSGTKFCMEFSWAGKPYGDMFVRAAMVFADPTEEKNRVETCVQCFTAATMQGKKNLNEAKHVLLSCSDDAYYREPLEPPNSWPSVLVKSNNSGGPFRHSFQCVCSNSCSGIRRRATNVVFTLEDSTGYEFGRQVVGLQVCASPLRDLNTHEAKHTKSLGGPSYTESPTGPRAESVGPQTERTGPQAETIGPQAEDPEPQAKRPRTTTQSQAGSDLALMIHRKDGAPMGEACAAFVRKKISEFVGVGVKARIGGEKLSFDTSWLVSEGFVLVTPMTTEAGDWLLQHEFGQHDGAELGIRRLDGARATIYLPGNKEEHPEDPMEYMRAQNDHRKDLRVDSWVLIARDSLPAEEKLTVEIPKDILDEHRDHVWISFEATQVLVRLVR